MPPLELSPVVSCFKQTSETEEERRNALFPPSVTFVIALQFVSDACARHKTANSGKREQFLSGKNFYLGKLNNKTFPHMV